MAEPIETLYIELQGRLDGLERTLKEAEQRLAQGGKQGAEAFSKGFASLDAKASAEVLQTATNLIKGYNDALKSADPRRIIEATTAVDQFKKSFADAPTVLRAVEQSLKQQDAALQKTSGTFRDFSGGLDQTITKIGSIAGIVAGGAIGLGAFDGLVRSVFSLAQEADRANTQAQLLAATLERNGISATAAEQSFRKTADALGVLPQQLNESSKLLINYGATLDQVAKLQEIGGASALAAGRSAADGADLIAQAITTENSALLNGIGIASNLSTAYQDYSKEVGKTVEQLSAQEKAQAAVNYLLKETQSEVEALPTLLGGLAGQQSKLNNEFKQLQLTLGEALIPAVTGAIRVLNQLLDNLPTVISVATTLAAIIGAQRLAGSFAVLNLSVTQGVSALASWAATTVTTTTVTAGLNTALNALKTFFLTSPAVIIAAGAALITFAQQASAAIAAAEKAAQASDQAFNKTESSRISALRTSSSEIDQLKGRIAALQAALSSIRLGELGGDAEATAAKIKQLRGELAALQAEQAKQNTAQATSNDLFKEARTLVENLQKAQDSLSARQIFAAQQAIEAFTKANKDGSAVISAVRAAIAEQNAQLKENEKSTKAATKAVSEWDNYLKSERLEAYRRGLEGMTEAQLRQEVANQRSSRAIEQLQAATARLNEIQTRRIELERQLAAQAANAPLEQSLAKLDRQYNLGTISAQQYLDAVNALLQAFSKQFASATKGSEEYDRLRGIILRLRDVQESLKDTLEETALAFQRQQAAIPLQGTIDALADAYKAAEITATEYKNAVDSLLRSESTKFAALEKGTTAYDDQRQVILQLRDIQADLISQLEQEARLRSEVQKAVIDQANSLRILSESGQESFIQNVAQQYVELSNLLGSGQVNARAAELADNLSRSLSSVQIDEGARGAIKTLLDELKKLADVGEEVQTRLAQDIDIPQSLFEFGNVIEEINTAFRANTALVQSNIISTEQAIAAYEEQARIIQDVVDSLTAQLAAQTDANATTDELAATTERLGKSKSLLDQLNQTILQFGGPSANALRILSESVFEARESINQFSNEGGLAQAFVLPPESIDFRDALQSIIAGIQAANTELEIGRINLDTYTQGQLLAVQSLEEFIVATLDQADALAESGQSGSAAYIRLIELVAQAKTQIDILNQSIIQNSEQSARALLILEKAALSFVEVVNGFTTEGGLAQAFVVPPESIDFRDAIDSITKSLEAAKTALSLGVIDADRFAIAQQDAATQTEEFIAAILDQAQALADSGQIGSSAYNALIALAGTAKTQLDALNLSIVQGSQQSAQALIILDKAALSFAETINEFASQGGIAQAFVLPPEAIDFKDALDAIVGSLQAAQDALSLGVINLDDFTVAQGDATTQLQEFIVAILDQAQALADSGQRGSASYNALIRLATQAKKAYDDLTITVVESSAKSAQALLAVEKSTLSWQETIQDTSEILAKEFAIPATFIDFRSALEGISTQLAQTSDQFQRGNLSVDDYRQTLLNTIGDLEVFSSTLDQLSQQYLNSGDAADQAFGAQLQQLVRNARNQIQDLSGELFKLNVDALVVDDLVQGFDRLDRTLARVQLPDILPDADLRNLLTAAGIDFGNFEQLGAALNNIPAPLRASSTLFGDFSDLVELSAQAQNRLAEAAGLALSQNQQLANQIRILAQELVVSGAISTDVALQYLELANQIGNTADNAKSGIDPFKALSSLTFQNFRELSISLDRIINPLTESGNAADLLQSALREAADAERLLSGAAADVDNQFTRQAETIREYAAQLEKTGQVAPDLITKLRSLARSLDIQAPLEEGRKKTEQLKNELLKAVDAFAGFGNLDIAGFDGLVSLSQGIAKLIGGDILGGIQSILAPYADLLEPILAPLGDGFTKILKSIQPLIAPLAKLATSIIVPLVELIANVLTPVIQVFADVFEQVGGVIQSVIDGLVYVYNQTLGKIFGQIGGGEVPAPLEADEQALIDRVEEVIGKIDDAARAAILEMSKNIYETLYKSFESALSEGLFDAITSGNLEDAKRALEEKLKKVVIQVIVDTAVKAAFATAAVADVLKKLSDEIAYAVATGDWTGVGKAINAAVSTVTGILDQLASVLIPNLGGLFGGGGGNVPISPINGLPSGPTAIQSPNIPIASAESIAAFAAGSKDIATAGIGLVEGLRGLELDEVASDMARSSSDFRAAVDQLSGILTNRTDWTGVNSR